MVGTPCCVVGLAGSAIAVEHATYPAAPELAVTRWFETAGNPTLADLRGEVAVRRSRCCARAAAAARDVVERGRGGGLDLEGDQALLVALPIGVYDSYMVEVAVSEARNRLAEVIEESRRSGEPISVTRRGRRVAVILDSDAFDRLVDSADDVEDRRELDAARADDDYVPWDEVKAALGLE